VVEVRVREQDRLEVEPELLDGAEELVLLVARIEDHGLVRALAADDVGVLLRRADGEHADFHQRGCPPC
jgi:hypothetical protein